MTLRLRFNRGVATIVSAYALQQGFSKTFKYEFYSDLTLLIVSINRDDFLLICDDFNGHVGAIASTHLVAYERHEYGFHALTRANTVYKTLYPFSNIRFERKK